MSQNPDPGRSPLRRVPGHPAADPPQGVDAPFLLDRYSVLTHELANLLDGSLRTLVLAQRTIDASGDPQTSALDQARHRLDTVHQALVRMTDLVRASAAGSRASIGSVVAGPRAPVTMGEAAHHAAEVLAPLADEHRVMVALAVQPEAGILPSGSLYTVLLNGLRNAIDAIMESSAGDCPEPGHPAGRVDVRIERTRDGRGEMLLIEIADTGAGPLPEAGEHPFRHGYTTKAHGHGIGLALSRQIVEHAGGTITLTRRQDRTNPGRPGAVLRIVVPVRAGETG